MGILDLGCWSGDAARPLIGGVSDLAIYNKVLSNTERQQLEGYLAYKWWGSGSVLAIGHPYRGFAPTPLYTPTIVLYTSAGTTSWTAPALVTAVDVLVVAGGGGGGGCADRTAGGGGAGGLIFQTSFAVTPAQ